MYLYKMIIARNFTHYKQRFSMPGDTQGMFYSFNLGLAHFVVINTEAYYFPTYGTDQIQTQYNWLKEDLRVSHESSRKM